MQLTSAPPVPTYDRAATIGMLNDIALELTRSDAQLTDAVYKGNRVGAGWDTWFTKTAQQVLDARDAYLSFNPMDRELAARLGADALDLAESGGQLGASYRAGNTFGRGWDTTLDRKIDDVRTASARLLDMIPSPNPGGPAPDPTFPGSGVADAARGARELVLKSLDVIRTVPAEDRGSDATKQSRIQAFEFNKQAQAMLEPHFETADGATVSQLRTADASLEDAAWQLAKKPSPDGRFNGVDIPGAIRDTEAALSVLDQLAAVSG